MNKKTKMILSACTVASVLITSSVASVTVKAAEATPTKSSKVLEGDKLKTVDKASQEKGTSTLDDTAKASKSDKKGKPNLDVLDTKVSNLVQYLKENYLKVLLGNADISTSNHKLTINLVNPDETLYSNYNTLVNKKNLQNVLDNSQSIILNNHSININGNSLQQYLQILALVKGQYINVDGGKYEVNTAAVVERLRDRYATFTDLITGLDNNYGQKQIPEIQIDGYTVTKVVKVGDGKNGGTIYAQGETISTFLKNLLSLNNLQDTEALENLKHKDLEGTYKVYLKYGDKDVSTPYIVKIVSKS